MFLLYNIVPCPDPILWEEGSGSTSLSPWAHSKLRKQAMELQSSFHYYKVNYSVAKRSELKRLMHSSTQANL